MQLQSMTAQQYITAQQHIMAQYITENNIAYLFYG